MPRPGDPYASAFVAEHMKCWRMIHDRQGKAAHCPETPSWTARWFSPRGDRRWPVWACESHLEGLTGSRYVAFSAVDAAAAVKSLAIS